MVRHHGIDQRRPGATGNATESRDRTEQPRSKRNPINLVVARQELEFDLGHIDRRGALGLASFALHTQIHDCVHALAGEGFGRQNPGKGGAQSIRPAAGALFFIPGDHKAGAHRPGGIFTANPRPVALLHRPVKSLRRRIAILAEIDMDGHH